MKILSYLIGSLAFAIKVFAENPAANDVSGRNMAPDLAELKRFNANYIIEEFPDHRREQVVVVYNGKKITLRYSITNEEDDTMTLVGIGGSILDPLSGLPRYNMTANSVQPIIINPHESGSLRQVIEMEFVAGNYILSPSVYVSFRDQLKEIKVGTQLIAVSDIPVSFFDPQFIFLVLIMSIAFGTIGYYIYSSYFQKYFRKTAPLASISNTTGTGSGLDPSWVPKNYVTISRKPKSRKGY